MRLYWVLILSIVFSTCAWAVSQPPPKMVQISTVCQKKFSDFSAHFANANMMVRRGTAVQLEGVTVSPSAEVIGESGFAMGNGFYRVSVREDDDLELMEVRFKFVFAMSPGCPLVKIEAGVAEPVMR